MTTKSQSKMRVIVADDEPHALSTLKTLVDEHPDLTLVAECQDGEDALARIVELNPDLIILDVRMPKATGLEVVASLPPERRPLVVFATAHDDYAVEAFDLHAVDYLLKPFDDDRFNVALTRARTRRGAEAPEKSLERIQGVIEEGGEDRIAIPRGGKLVLVSFDDIAWVEAADQYVKLHLLDGKEELMRASMSHLEKRLPSPRFLRVHRSAIVRLDQVRDLSSATSGTGQINLRTGGQAPVSRTRLALVRKALR